MAFEEFVEDSQKKIVESLKKGEAPTELEVSQQVKNRYLKIRDLIEAENERQLKSAQKKTYAKKSIKLV